MKLTCGGERFAAPDPSPALRSEAESQGHQEFNSLINESRHQSGGR